MNWAGARQWARFYGKLVLVNAWNGFIYWFVTLVGAGGVQAAKALAPPYVAALATDALDLQKLGWKGAAWALASTMLACIGFALARHLLPDPSEPQGPEASV